MEIRYLLTVAELILAVGDDPGHAVRYYSTMKTPGGKSVNQLKITKLEDMLARGLLVDEGAIVRGRPASSLRLSPSGQAVYALMCAARALPEV